MLTKDYYPDAELIRSYINGDESSLQRLVNRYETRIFNFIFSKIYDRDLANDIFQDTFIKVIRTLKKGKYNEEGKFLPWVMRIAHNLIIDHFRKNKRMPKFDHPGDFEIFDILEDEQLNAEKSIVKDQKEKDLKLLIEELPKDQCEVLKMRIYQDFSFKEIAYKTDVSINTALGRMRYALINLRKKIGEKDLKLLDL
jgi:RNA polymerase sigma-70 factor (ECF subfamily)